VRDRWGVETSYLDAEGRARDVGDDTIEAIHAVIGDPVSPRRPMIVRADDRAAAPAGCLVLDDACAEPERPNIPGADADRANWSLALPRALEDLEADPLATRIATALRAAVQEEHHDG
jgi:4-alpha-glucanotransferase